ncbi:MAG TPA: hypothetical protein VFI47_27740 [Acidimicrobiales bacterium]|nr:hypothetical protein [Acidimicrobiales bacterium]
MRERPAGEDDRAGGVRDRRAVRVVEEPFGQVAWGIAERIDDYCATAYVYCTEAQAVSRVDPALATADIARRPYETAGPTEALAQSLAEYDGDLESPTTSPASPPARCHPDR